MRLVYHVRHYLILALVYLRRGRLYLIGSCILGDGFKASRDDPQRLVEMSR
jgi:hypothetical protein